MKPRIDIACFGYAASAGMGYLTGMVEVTDACFQHCLLCDSWRERKSVKEASKQWSLPMLKELARQTGDMPDFRHLALTGGDPQAWEPLPEFLSWWADNKMAGPRSETSLQLNTALARSGCWELWRIAVDRVRVSLDAVQPHIYSKMRADSVNDPIHILNRMQEMQHPNLSTITTVCPENIEQVPMIIEALAGLGLPIRKAMFLAALGHRRGAQDEMFWQQWMGFEATGWGVPFEVSLRADSVAETRAWCGSEAAYPVRCWVPRASFYLKADGEAYPCCLIGGEAISTVKRECIGKFPEMSLDELYEAYHPMQMYTPRTPCRDICQYKQAVFNQAAEAAFATTLTMP